MSQNSNRFLRNLGAALCFAFVAGAAQAHPHVWVTMKSVIVYAPDGGVTGVRQAWTFDDMYSSFATQGLDSAVKGQFTREELAPLAQVNIESLKEFDYFTEATMNGKKAEFSEPVDYWLDYTDSVLTLHFTLPVKTPIKTQTFEMQVYDPTYFVDFALAEKDAVALASAPTTCKLTIGKPQEMNAALAKRLAEIPPGGTIPGGSYGAQFANKISVKC
jgi:ABC-type uncharacterized transport system substrate-binding protein